MSPSSVQLLEPNFQPGTQGCLWPESTRALRFVVKLHRATQLHYDLRFELYGRLLSFVVNDLNHCWSTTASIVRIDDHDLKHILGEHRTLPGKHSTGPMLVWDHGIYRSDLGTEKDIYRQLQKGCLEIDLQGIRLNGRFRIRGCGRSWCIQRLSGIPPSRFSHSVLTGCALDESESGITSMKSAKRLWMEWENFYAQQTAEPEIIVYEKKVIDINFGAKTRGISVSMSLQHALPLVPHSRITPFAPAPNKQKAWLDRLLPFSDTIQPFDYHSAVLDLAGHPDPGDIAGKIVTNVTEAGFGHLCYGTGPSLWIARLATQLKDPYGFSIDPAGKLAPLNVEHLLAVPEHDRERLLRLGFETIGEIAATSIEQLYRQFGESAHTIVTAAQGKTCDQVASLYPARAAVETLRFAAPVNDSLTLEDAAKTLTHRLIGRIKGQQAGLAILTVEREDGTEHTLQRSYNRALHTPDRIQASLDYLSGELQKSCSDIVRLTARLDRLEPLKSSQQDLFVATTYTEKSAALASIQASFGQKSVVLASEIVASRREQVLKAWRNATGWN